ncbi:hypothetical protein SELMODRAFT_271071 [Selaginella moellendorffii]|uniref:Uncharacterized protein n=1 Tax=Selaginella moellendorffii TaxID=88036 RepID=D8RTB5_SELML|nr:cytokinin hydroxylase [Selaginella moellendorffii]EFJ24654.1 hypothetical protein SELMODRAFT_271071 [Selaginella moellendorffii]|eukprot:XP_024534926.1 cytokinin hydroxylase [Selaginella moellendorffii]
MEDFLWKILCSCGVFLVVWLLVPAARSLWHAWRFRCFYAKQGIPGPPFRLIVGNIPEIRKLFNSVPKFETSFHAATKFRVIPDLATFQQTYGRISVHELGSTTRILVADTELVKQVLMSRSSSYIKADLSRQILRAVVGRGVVVTDGDFWRQQRKILNPAFKLAYLKGLMRHMSGAGEDLARKWSSRETTRIDAHREMAALTLDVITRASFGATIGGTNTGYAAFECLDRLLSTGLLYMNSYKRLIPGYSFLPTRENLHLRRSEQYVNTLLRDIIRNRWAEKTRNPDENGKPVYDLLDMMLEAVENKSPTMTMDQLLDECKTIFFAGHSTTALTLTWSLIMLSVHQEWQQRARDEIFAAHKRCGGRDLSAEDLSSLEVVGWIIHEVLRLFPPVSTVTRQCHQAHEIGEFSILPGTLVLCPLALLLQSKEDWGDDVSEFNPERFINKKTKDISEFMAFGAGPRMCLGMNFALIEARLLLSLLLAKFSFTLAEDYVHAPGSPVSMKPVYGAPLLVKKL